jgi:hypothetical protein
MDNKEDDLAKKIEECAKIVIADEDEQKQILSYFAEATNLSVGDSLGSLLGSISITMEEKEQITE